MCAQTRPERKEAGFLAREKISDSLLDGFRAESDRAGEDGVPDVEKAAEQKGAPWDKGGTAARGI